MNNGAPTDFARLYLMDSALVVLHKRTADE